MPIFGPTIVQNNVHDGYQGSSGWSTGFGGELYCSSLSFDEWGGFGWDLSSIPDGSTIDSAYISGLCNVTNGSVTLRIAIEDADPSTNTPWSDSHLPKISSGASYIWESANITRSFSAGVQYFGNGENAETDISEGLQNLIDTYGGLGWVNFALRPISSGSSFVGFEDVSDSSALDYPFNITVNYTEPSGSTYTLYLGVNLSTSINNSNVIVNRSGYCNSILDSNFNSSIAVTRNNYGNIEIQTSIPQFNSNILYSLYSNYDINTTINDPLIVSIIRNINEFVDIVTNTSISNININRSLYNNSDIEFITSSNLLINRLLYSDLNVNTNTSLPVLLTSLLFYCNNMINTLNNINSILNVDRAFYINSVINTEIPESLLTLLINNGTTVTIESSTSSILSILRNVYTNVVINNLTTASELIFGSELSAIVGISTETSISSLSLLRNVYGNFEISCDNLAYLNILRNFYSSIGIESYLQGNTLTFSTTLSGDSLDIVKFTVNMMKVKYVDLSLMKLKKFNMDL